MPSTLAPFALGSPAFRLSLPTRFAARPRIARCLFRHRVAWPVSSRSPCQQPFAVGKPEHGNPGRARTHHPSVLIADPVLGHDMRHAHREPLRELRPRERRPFPERGRAVTGAEHKQPKSGAGTLAGNRAGLLRGR